MKKFLAIALLVTSSSVALADNDIGCGLGYNGLGWTIRTIAPKILAVQRLTALLATKLLALLVARLAAKRMALSPHAPV